MVNRQESAGVQTFQYGIYDRDGALVYRSGDLALDDGPGIQSIPFETVDRIPPGGSLWLLVNGTMLPVFTQPTTDADEVSR